MYVCACVDREKSPNRGWSREGTFGKGRDSNQSGFSNSTGGEGEETVIMMVDSSNVGRIIGKLCMWCEFV